MIHSPASIESRRGDRQNRGVVRQRHELFAIGTDADHRDPSADLAFEKRNVGAGALREIVGGSGAGRV
jgi:hypothetical protein